MADKIDFQPEGEGLDFQPEQETVAPAPDTRTTGQKIAGAVAPYARPVLEVGGAIAGGALATPETMGLGTIGGAALGYAGGRQAANALEEYAGTRKPATMGEAATQAATDIPVGAAMEAGGQLAGKAVGTAAEALAPKLKSVAERIYGSATKMPLSKKWTQVLPGREVSDRVKAIRAGLDSGIMPTERGLQEVANLEAHTRSLVDDLVTTGTKSGDTVKTADILRGLDKAYESASKSADPKGAASIVDIAAEKFMNRPSTITTEELNGIKRQIYKEVSDYNGEFKSINDTAQKGLANAAMKKLEDFYPSIRGLNQKDASYIKLKEAIERTVAREQNKDIVGLGSKVLAVKNIPIALWESTIGHPVVKAKIAIALAKSGKSTATADMMHLLSMPATRAAVENANFGASEAEAATLSDYAKGADNPRQVALREAAQDQPVSRRTAAQAQPAFPTGQNNEANRQAALARMSAQQGQSTRPRIDVQEVTVSTPDGEEIKYRDKSGKYYDFDPNAQTLPDDAMRTVATKYGGSYSGVVTFANGQAWQFKNGEALQRVK